MDKIVIAVEVEPIGSKEAVDSIEKVKKANDKFAESAAKHHGEAKTHHKEQIDLNTKLTHSFAELGEGIVAAFAVEKIIEFGEECIKAFEEAEQAASQLSFAVKNIAKEGESGIERLEKQVQRLSTETGNLFSEKDIQKAQTRLIELGYTTEETTKLLDRISEMAAQKGTSLEEMATAVSNAFEGSNKALKKMGIEMPILGESVQDLNRFFKESEQYQGALQKAMETTAGVSRQTANTIEKDQETLGSFIAKPFVNMKNALVTGLSDLIGANDEALNQAREKYLADVAKITGKATEEQVKEDEEVKKEAEENELKSKAKHVLDLSKLTTADLEKRLEATKQGDLKIIAEQDETQNVYEELKEKGLEKEGARIEKEIEARKKANDKLLDLWKKYLTQLEQIKKRDAEDSAKFNIELIEDETLKKIAVADYAAKKEQADLREREAQLKEIVKAGINSRNKERHDAAVSAQKELTVVNKDIELSEEVHQKKILEIIKKAEDEDEKQRIENNKKNAEAKITLSEQDYENARIEAKRALVNGKIDKEKYDTELKEIEIKSLEDKLAIEESYGIEDYKLAQEIELKKLELQDESNKKLKEKNKELLESIKEVATQMFESINAAIEENITAIDGQMERQNRMIDEQKVLAEKGLKNDLAFEEKRADELDKKKAEEEKKLKRIKELEVFLNSVATYTQQGNNPAEAVGKALGILAATKAAEAVYAEEGGILGQTSARSYVGLGSMSRMHRGGGDVLLHAQKGEGIIPKSTMENWGLTDNSKFSQFLKNPFNEKLIQGSRPMVINDNSAVVSRLESLEETIRNKKETIFEIDEFNQLIKTEFENGIKRITKDINLSNRRTRI